MARLSLSRPARFFTRKKTAASDQSTAVDSSSPDWNSEDESNIRPGTGVTSRSHSCASSADQTTIAGTNNINRNNTASPRRRSTASRSRRSSSLSRLREKCLDRGPDVPESVQEQRESILLLDQHSNSEAPSYLGISTPRRGSGSETLAVEEASSREGKTPDVEEVRQELLGEVDAGQQTRHDSPPALVVEEPTPDVAEEGRGADVYEPVSPVSPLDITPQSVQLRKDSQETAATSASISPAASGEDTKKAGVRPPSIVDSANAKIVNTLINAPARQRDHTLTDSSGLPTGANSLDFSNMAHVLHRKIWVRRPGASATLVQIREDDLVDDVRDMILKKYANSLGKTFDAPDMTLRIVSRVEQGQPRQERTLGPEEEMCRTIDTAFPGGQTVEEALIIDVPTRERRTPRASPRAFQHPSYHALDDYRPLENGTDYFPPMPAAIPSSIPQSASSHDGRIGVHAHHPSIAAGMNLEPPQRSISVLNTGQVPPLPSPGSTLRSRAHKERRPNYQRQHTSSPTIISHSANQAGTAVAVGSGPPPPSLNVNPAHPLVHRQSGRPREGSIDAHSNGVPAAAAPQPPTPPTPETLTGGGGSTPPTPSQNPATTRGQRPRKTRRATPENKVGSRSKNGHGRSESQQAAGIHPSISSVLDGSVPPINVLIVEDNIINLRILEGLMKRLRVRWQTAMNGQIAVDKWKAGGYHLVLMDIQMPVMNGLAATKEIRRLERVNGIGAFSAEPSSESNSPEGEDAPKSDEEKKKDESSANGTANGNDKKSDDKIQLGEGMFKSPVIIVALTASSLQSDRHEALAAGCNDFLTKPVNFVWLERKVKEWGCMQALIDFDGWRKWKEIERKEEEGKSEAVKEEERKKEEKERIKMEKFAKVQEKQRIRKEEEERKKKRASLQQSEAGTSATAGNAVAMNGEAEAGKANGVSASEG